MDSFVSAYELRNYFKKRININWNLISRNQISWNQKLSKEFIEKFKHKN
jgi:hypothetical protein